VQVIPRSTTVRHHPPSSLLLAVSAGRQAFPVLGRRG